MTFTRKATGFENPADYEFLFNGEKVGRCYRGNFGSTGKGWRWSVYGTNLCGIEETLDVAQEKFKEAFLGMAGRPNEVD
ncbi:hypothetical protein [Pseudorhodoplanes sp.]|uniref:hypothetical protein n=1 Tax=Pseudorhodoplanes sp. TaxID=1934341 RepID=UPI002C0CE12B|nr:hypothetical protein [Pseudorhodoplanes sp.]HWV44152.1 hypothetical protein [Pseudorhodoplanes sp.]